jgi:hypothetical protein
MSEVLTQVAASVMIGILSWIGSRALSYYKQKRAPASATIPPMPASAPGIVPPVSYPLRPPTPSVDLSAVLIHIGILQLVGNIVGVITGFFGGALGFSEGLLLLALFFFGTVTEIIMFLIFGLRVERPLRWRHLTYVALGTIPLTLVVNALAYALQGRTLYTSLAEVFGAIVFATFQTFLSMGIGGGLAALFAPKRGLQPLGQVPLPPIGYPPAGTYPYSGGYPQPGAYPPPPGSYAPPSGYPPPAGYPQPGAYPPQPGSYPAAPGAYPTQPGAYPPPPSSYPQPGNYPTQPGSYPPPGAYPQPGAYPPPSGYPPPGSNPPPATPEQ